MIVQSVRTSNRSLTNSLTEQHINLFNRSSNRLGRSHLSLAFDTLGRWELRHNQIID